MLIILSDGHHAPHPDFRDYDTKAEAGKAEQALDYLFSVGIQSEAVRDFYKDYVVVNSTDDLPEAITNCFRRVVGKRIR